jgi:hypothetical protein
MFRSLASPFLLGIIGTLIVLSALSMCRAAIDARHLQTQNRAHISGFGAKLSQSESLNILSITCPWR